MPGYSPYNYLYAVSHALKTGAGLATSTEPTSEGQVSLIDQIAPTVPGLADLTKRVLLGEVWERPDLTKRERSLVTLAALISMARTDMLADELIRAKEHGVTDAHIRELIQHLAFYAGWPAAVAAAQAVIRHNTHPQYPAADVGL